MNRKIMNSMISSLKVGLWTFILSAGVAYADRQAIVGTITSSGFVQGTPTDAVDGLIKETELRLNPTLPTEDAMDNQIVHLKTQSTQDLIIPLGAFLPATWTLRYTVWGNNQANTGTMEVAHWYTTSTTFEAAGPWITSREGFGKVKLLAKRQVYNGGWGVLYYLQIDRIEGGTQPIQVSVTLETNNRLDEVYGTNDNALTSLEVPEVFAIDQYTKKVTINSTVDVTGSMNLNGSSVATSSTLQSQGYLQPSTLSSALNSAIPPTTAAWSAAYVRRGAVTNGAYLSFGDLSSASALNSTAIGYSSVASGPNSIANGHGAVATGESSVALGNGASATYSYSTSHGIGTTASGSCSRAYGYYSNSSGIHSIASGYYSSSTGSYSQASGSYSIASGIHSSASGVNAIASGNWSTARGFNITASSSTETVFGRYNIVSASNSATAWNGSDGLLRVGNGASGAPSDAMTVLKSGQTQLTNKEWKAAVTASPGSDSTALADPASTTDSEGNALVVDGHTILNGKVIISIPQGDISMGIYE